MFSAETTRAMLDLIFKHATFLLSLALNTAVDCCQCTNTSCLLKQHWKKADIITICGFRHTEMNFMFF